MTKVTVTVAETLKIKVGRFIHREYPNIAFSDSSGLATRQLTEGDSIGLLDDTSGQVVGWFKSWFTSPRRTMYGVLWLSNKARNATQNNWVIEVYGDDSLPLMKELADKLSSEFQTSVHLKLVSERVQTETFISDYAM
jgi:hypothetical protein